MKLRHLLPACVFLAACSGRKEPPWDFSRPVSAGEARAGRTEKEADLVLGTKSTAKVGDFKLYNSRVQFIVEDVRPSSGFGPYGGGIAAADRVREDGSTRSLFGELIHTVGARALNASSVEVVRDGAGGGAAQIRVSGRDGLIPLIDAVIGGGSTPTFPDLDLDLTTDYVLEPDAEAVKVTLSFRKRGGEAVRLGPFQFGLVMGDGLARYLEGQGFPGLLGPKAAPFYGAVGEEVSYSIYPLGRDFTLVGGLAGLSLGDLGYMDLNADAEGRQTFYVAVGDGDVASLLRIHDGIRSLKRSHLAGKVVDKSGNPLARARVHMTRPDGAYVNFARTAVDGTFDALVPAGATTVQAVAPGRPPMQPVTVEVPEDGTASATLTLDDSATIKLLVTEQSLPIPAKAILFRQQGPSPSYPTSYGEPRAPAGAAELRFMGAAEETIPVIPGTYRVLAMRGFEYDLAEQVVTVEPGQTQRVALEIRHVVDTVGWLSGDFHSHGAPSPDTDDLVTTKALAFAAEHVEVPATTDHDVIFDYQPTVEALGLAPWVRTMPAEEVTSTTYGHFNIFPCQVLDEPNGGAVSWYFKSALELFAEMRKNPAGPLIQVNHPRSSVGGGYFATIGLDAATLTSSRRPGEFVASFDLLEVLNGKRADDVEFSAMPDWFSLLNHGLKVTGTGNSDSHSPATSEVGTPRNYVHLGVDSVVGLDLSKLVAALKVGRVSVSAGPFLTMTANGKGMGELAALAGGRVAVSVAMQAPTWMGPVEKVELVRNGQLVRTVDVTPADADPANPAMRYRGTLEDAPAVDSWYLLIARSANGTLSPLTGGRPYAFTNPVFVDVNGNGKFDPPL